MIRLARLLHRDRRGTSLVEFAILMPVMLLLFLGGYQLSDAVACKRRVGITSRAVADMVSQSATASTGDIDAILAAATQIMAPYSLANATVRVSEVQTDSSGANGANPKVIWSRTKNGTVRAVGSAVEELPAAMRQKNSYYIFAEVTYSYVPVISTLMPAISFTQTLWMLPRKSSSVDITS